MTSIQKPDQLLVRDKEGGQGHTSFNLRNSSLSFEEQKILNETKSEEGPMQINRRIFFPYSDGENFRVPCEIEGLAAMAIIDTGAQSSLISSEMKLRINARHPGFTWNRLSGPPCIRGLQDEPLNLEPFSGHINIRTCGREICGPVNVDPSNVFDILLGIPAIKALGIELKIKKEYELRPTYGPLRFAECNKADESELKQVTALERAVVDHERVQPPPHEAAGQTVIADAPISKVDLKSPHS